MFHHCINIKKCIPDFHVENVYALDAKSLYDRGFRVLLVDIDNTLMSYEEKDPTDRVRGFVSAMHKEGLEIVLISNNRKKRIKPYADALGVPCIFGAKKPLKRGFLSALKKLDTAQKKEAVLVVGDQLLTDVYGAKRAGLSVALVRPIRKETEKWFTRLNRIVERKILKKIAKRYPEKYEALELAKR